MPRSRNTQESGGTRTMPAGIEELSQDQIDALLASSKQRGEYDRQLVNFMGNDAPGVQVSLTEGPFQGKKAQSVKTGFDGALTRARGDKGEYSDEQREASKGIRVIVNDEKVFLVRQS